MRMFEYKGKMYDLKFTYASIVYLEGAFQKPYLEVLSSKTGNELLFKLMWACTRHHEDFKHNTPLDFIDIVEEIVVHGDTSFGMLQELAQEAFLQSNYVKEFLERVKDAAPTESQEAGE